MKGQVKAEFEARLEKMDSPLWQYHLPVPDEVAQPLVQGTDRRVVCGLNGAVEFQCGLMPKGDGTFFILLNKKVRDQLKLAEGQSVAVSLQPDNSKYGLPMPEELEELLLQDADGDRLFHALTPGKQRNLLYIAGQVKSPEKRLARAMAIVEHLKKNDGQIQFKELNQDIREASKRGL